MQVNGSSLWDGASLWNNPRFGPGYDEAAFWDGQKRDEA
jgi:hypothetical protein